MSGLAVVTRMAMAKRPDLQAIRPAGRVNSLVFDALCALDAPRVETVAHWAGVTVGQAGAAIDRLRARGLAEAAGFVPAPGGGRRQTYRPGGGRA